MRSAQPLEGGRAMTTVEAAANLLCLSTVSLQYPFVSSAHSLLCCKFREKKRLFLQR